MTRVYRDKKVSFTINGEKFEGVLRKGLEMANKEKYIPKVGDKVLCELNSECIVLYVGQELVLVRNESEEFSAEFDYFKPIPNKSDVEREQLKLILGDYVNATIDETINRLQNAKFTIPKKVKLSEIEKLVKHWVSFTYDGLIDDICNLLGDLVENDQ